MIQVAGLLTDKEEANLVTHVARVMITSQRARLLGEQSTKLSNKEDTIISKLLKGLD